jgi:DNA-binding transcriptional MerR regulator
MYKIGDIKTITGHSPDTLRYYEKIGVLPTIARNSSGLRLYDKKDISHLQFIKRAQSMNFTLDEIKSLLKMRENPIQCKDSIRQLTFEKLQNIEEQLKNLTTMKKEFTLLLNLCRGSKNGCPIIEDFDQ